MASQPGLCRDAIRIRNVQEESNLVKPCTDSTGQIKIEIQLVAVRFFSMMIDATAEEKGVGSVTGANPEPDAGQETEQSQPERWVKEEGHIKTMAAHHSQQTHKTGNAGI